MKTATRRTVQSITVMQFTALANQRVLIPIRRIRRCVEESRGYTTMHLDRDEQIRVVQSLEEIATLMNAERDEA